MKRNALLFGITIAVTLCGWAQSEMRVDITSFEDGRPWIYTGPVLQSLVDLLPSAEGVPQLDGENALFVEYDTGDNGWQWAQLNFQNGPVDLTDMLELHMWVYFLDGTTGELSFDIRLVNGDGSTFELGKQIAPSTGQWHELVFPINRLASKKINNVSWWGGFISPGNTQAKGVVFIDNIFAIRPANTPILEDILVYDFEEADSATGYPVGWGKTWETDIAPSVGTGEVPASSGNKYMQVTLQSSWRFAAQTTNALDAFDRWMDAKEILFDVRTVPNFIGGWLQSTIVIQSGVNDASGNNLPEFETWDQYGELGYADAKSAWKTLIFKVNMSKHAAAMAADGTWFQIFITVNHGSDSANQKVYIDNFRVAVEQEASGVDEWSLH